MPLRRNSRKVMNTGEMTATSGAKGIIAGGAVATKAGNEAKYTDHQVSISPKSIEREKERG